MRVLKKPFQWYIVVERFIFKNNQRNFLVIYHQNSWTTENTVSFLVSPWG